MIDDILLTISTYNPDALAWFQKDKCRYNHIFKFEYVNMCLIGRYTHALKYLLPYTTFSAQDYDLLYEDSIRLNNVVATRLLANYVNIHSDENMECFLFALRNNFLDIVYFLLDQNIQLYIVFDQVMQATTILMNDELTALLVHYIRIQYPTHKQIYSKCCKTMQHAKICF